MLKLAHPAEPSSSEVRGTTTMEAKMPVLITNPRGTRAAWEEGLFDALVLCVQMFGAGEAMSHADRTLLSVSALKRWPNNSVVAMVDRVLSIEDTIASGGQGAAEAMLAERDRDTHLLDALFTPVLMASTLRPLSEAEVERLMNGIQAAGASPGTFGLRL